MAESTGFAERIHKYAQSAETQILPLGFNPTDRDVICGRARENFHHGKCDKEFENDRDVGVFAFRGLLHF